MDDQVAICMKYHNVNLNQFPFTNQRKIYKILMHIVILIILQAGHTNSVAQKSKFVLILSRQI